MTKLVLSKISLKQFSFIFETKFTETWMFYFWAGTTSAMEYSVAS